MLYLILFVGVITVILCFCVGVSNIKLFVAYLRIKYFKDSVPDSELINRNIIKINYSYKSRLYSVYLPLRKVGYNNLNIRYTLIEGDKMLDITQQPGIEYYVTPRMLSGDAIISKKFDEVTGTYEADQVPMIYIVGT